MKLNSKKYPDITYEKGEEIQLYKGDLNLPFDFDVEEELTSDDEAMAIVADMLDHTDLLVQKAKDFLKEVLAEADEDDEDYETIADFMEFHRDDIEPELVSELFPVPDPSELSFEEMIDYLELNRFGSLVYDDDDQQAFIMDLSFDPDVTDELMVVYFNLEKEVIYITQES